MEPYVFNFSLLKDSKETNNNRVLPERASSIYNQQWFPANPDCPNHRNVSFSSSFNNAFTSGSVQCMECLLNSTIRHHVHENQACKIKNEILISSSNNEPLHVFGPPDSNYSNIPQSYTQTFPVIDLSNNNNKKSKISSFCSYLNKVEKNIDDKVLGNLKTKGLNGRKRKGENDLCQVCGDHASGYHYNALTCEGCKGFFRRSINRSHLLDKCKLGGNCEMDTYTRRKCPECRMKKCKAVGMLEECLLSPIQIQSKRKRYKQKVFEQPSNGALNKKIALTFQEEKCLTNFVRKAFQDYRENPAIVNGWKYYVEKDYHNTEKPSICNLATKHVQVLVTFIKKLPGFTNLSCDDQISLIKGSVVPIMLLRNSCNYNLRRVQLEPEHVAKYGGIEPNHVKLLLDFFSKTKKIGIDETEYGLLVAIIAFDSDHKNVQDKLKVDVHRDKYLSALTRYSEERRKWRPCMLAKILSTMVIMQDMYFSHSNIITNWKQRQEMTPLLYEVWEE